MKKIALVLIVSLAYKAVSAQWNPNGNNIYYNVGHVGVGTSTPSTYWGRVLQVFDNNNAVLSVKTPVADWQFVTDASGGLHFRDITGGGNAGRLFIASNGNVGIGTTSPSSQLHLFNPSSSTYLYIEKPSTTSEGGILFSKAGTPLFYLFNDNDDDALKIEANGLPGEADATPRMMFPKSNKNIYMAQSGGNVGIGTASPTSKLSLLTSDLGQNSGDRVNLFASETSVGNLSAVELYTYRYTGGSDWLSATTRLQQRIDGTNMGYIEFNPPYASWGIALGTNSGQHMVIGNNGSVGIGTGSISDNNYGLFVEKGIRTRKVKVDHTNWPDYVFHSSYKLPSLKEVEEFIKQNNHLPDVPSASEVEKNGLDLGDNQAVLLKKIEELTLYIIDINKKVDKLTEENEKLKKKLSNPNQ